MLWLWLFISGLILVIVLLLIKIHLLRKSAKEIECSFAEKLITDKGSCLSEDRRTDRSVSIHSISNRAKCD